MDPQEFRQSPSGQLVPTIENSFAFVPNPLPPVILDLSPLISNIERASRALGELSGIGAGLPNPELLIKPLARVEAVASSKIEGTVTSPSELLMLELSEDGANARSDTREVNNYNKALRHGLARIAELPLSTRLLNEMHAILMDGVTPERGARVVPGEMKRAQNWIGARTIKNARFVPPPPAETLIAVSDFEKFANQHDDDLPLLIKVAMLHYQFETIHPYPDGNGRVGRLIIPLYLCERKAMSQPLFYLSPYFEKHYNQYIDSMLEVSRSGAWNEWFAFFLEGVEAVSVHAIKKVKALQELRQNYLTRVQSARTSGLLAKLIDALFDVPATTIPYAARDIGTSYNAAKNNINKLVELGIVVNLPISDSTKWYFAEEIMSIANDGYS